MTLSEMYEKCKKLDPKIWIGLYVIFSIILLYCYPSSQVSHFEISNATAVATLENQYRMTLAQILGGGAVAIGIYFAWKNLEVAKETLISNHDNALKNLEVAQATLKSNQDVSEKKLEVALATLDSNMKNAQENLKVTQDGQITERFTRAVDQLGATDKDGNPSIEIRLGGIYALERIANESKKDYWPIMEILTAYIRKNSSVKDQRVQGRDRVQFDIQAILSVIKKRNKSDDFKVDLSNTYLEGADLTGADLTEAHLEGTNLTGADLREAHLEGAHLEGAHLEGAHLTKYDNTDSDYDESGYISGYFITKEANLKGAHLRKAHLGGAYLRKAHLEETDLTEAHLEETDLTEAHLEGANFTRAHLEGANFTEAHFEKTDFIGAHLDGANFTKVDLKDDTSNSTNFREFTKKSDNLTSDQLSKVKTLRGAKLNEKIKEELREKNSALIEEIDGGQ